jgi:hypothetical protein
MLNVILSLWYNSANNSNNNINNYNLIKYKNGKIIRINKMCLSGTIQNTKKYNNQ